MWERLDLWAKTAKRICQFWTLVVSVSAAGSQGPGQQPCALEGFVPASKEQTKVESSCVPEGIISSLLSLFIPRQR